MNHYVNSAQADKIKQYKKTLIWRSQWPTWLLIITIYVAWFLSLYFSQDLGIWLSSLLLVWINSWYMSLQHELLHGHPTPWDSINRIFGLVPFALFYPYDLYKEQHLIHHQDQYLTDPILDPESNYIAHKHWVSLKKPAQYLYQLNRTLVGRLLLGPLLSIFTIITHLTTAFAQRNTHKMRMWSLHLILVGTLVYILKVGFDFPIWLYLLICYASLSLALIRSFYEHRPASNMKHRSVVNEAGLVFRLLYLDNNYHAVHHDLPHVPWYMLKKIFKADQADYLAQNDHFHYDGYWSLFKHYSIHSIDCPIASHPIASSAELNRSTSQQNIVK